MRHIKWLVIALLVATGATAQTINCPSGFSSTGPCATTGSGTSANFQIFGNGGANLSGSTIILQPTGVVHDPNSVMYETPVNVQAFTTNFRFVPNAWNLASILENLTHNAAAGPPLGCTLASSFGGGARCEGGFYQAFGPNGDPPANNILFLISTPATYLSTVSRHSTRMSRCTNKCNLLAFQTTTSRCFITPTK
jgi:hypothetical protein